LRSRTELIQQLETYRTTFEEEQAMAKHFLHLLQHERCYYRDHLPGHITGSAWIVNKDLSHVVLVHHAKLNKWLQPGGHADGDDDIYRVSLREAEEETGLQKLELFTPAIFDIDIHSIPAHDDFPEHLHFDIRFAFQTTTPSNLVISQESHDVKWIALEHVQSLAHHNTSILRMLKKTTAR
jgi:8-oxo-dGTP pyrophosphatase MutT (NUDIX family)